MYKARSAFRSVTIFFSIFYFSILAYLVFFSRRRRHIHIRKLNLVPVKRTVESFAVLSKANPVSYYTDLFGNIIIFMPIAFIMVFVFRIDKPARIILTGFLISFFIELCQYIFVVGYSDIDDIILNTLGTALGYLLYKAIKKWIPQAFIDSSIQ